MANGQVITGFSKPKVAVYSYASNAVTYASRMALARGVSVELSLETSDTTDFHADNVVAESAGGVFTGGTVTLTVDGLKEEARRLLMGLPAAEKVNDVDVYVYDDRQVIPYVGVGFVVRVMENGITSYIPYVLTKVIFEEDGLSAETQGESIEFQTSELTGTLMRDDTANHAWRKIGAGQTTEAAAEAVIDSILGA